MLRIALFTDEPVLASGLAAMLSSSPECSLLPVSETVAEFVARVRDVQPDVVLVDMTRDVTFSLLVEIQQSAPGSQVLLWTRDISPEMAHQAVQNGVRGVLRKTASATLVVKCFKTVAAGELWFEKGLTDRMIQSRMVPLTRREDQLVGLLAQGLKNKEIATTLGISEGTVKVYLSRLYEKVGAKDRFELALYGLRNLQNAMGGASPVAPRNTKAVISFALGRDRTRHAIANGVPPY